MPEWEPVQMGDQFAVWGGRLAEPQVVLATREVSTNKGREKFVHFALGKTWVVHALGLVLRGSRFAPCQRGGVWKVAG